MHELSLNDNEMTFKDLEKNYKYNFIINFYFGYNYVEKQKEENKDLKKQLENKQKQLETNAGFIEAKYGEFAESVHRNNIIRILKLVMNKFARVEACHLYTYNLLRIEDAIKIKVNFLYGAEQEGTCINVIK